MLVLKVHRIFLYVTSRNIVFIYQVERQTLILCVFQLLPDCTSLQWVQLRALLALEVFGKVDQIGLGNICPPRFREVAIHLGVTFDKMVVFIFTYRREAVEKF